MRKKLRSQRGDTLVETLAALLIVAPITLIYLFTQKFLVAGIERTGLVG